MLILAPAKINLHLRVGPRRADGFHPLLTWMCSVGLFDKLTFAPAAQPGFSLRCQRADVPVDASNLILKAAAALAPLGTRPAGGLAIELDKQIPMGAGLGGGSADAARTLLALRALWNWDLPTGALERIAARLGSDLNFFFHAPSAICRGRGEEVEEIRPPAPGWAVLLLPAITMPTPAVYRRFDELGLGDPEAVARTPDWAAWCRQDSRQLLEQLVNDLEAPAFDLEPRLARLRAEAEQMVSRPVRMSGSGSSLFTLFDAEAEAQTAARQLQSRLGASVIPVELAPEIRDDLHENPAAV